MFDADQFVERTLQAKAQPPSRKLPKECLSLPSTPLLYPSYKVPPNNLSKLTYEKRIVHIQLDIKFPRAVLGASKATDAGQGTFVLRDFFDWDIQESHIRPKIFAQQLIDGLTAEFLGTSSNQPLLTESQKQKMKESVELQILDQIWQHIEKNTNVPTYAKLPTPALKVSESDFQQIPIANTHNQQTHQPLGGNLGILRLSRKDEIIVTELNKCVNCDSMLGIPSSAGFGSMGAQTMVGQQEYCRHCCFYFERRPGAISGMLSVNGPFGAGSGVQHDKKEPGAGANKDQQGSGANANQTSKEKGSASGTVNFPVLQKMHPKELMDLGIIKDEEGLEEEASREKEETADEKEPWKKRQQTLSSLYKCVNKETKICKKCNTSNPFFMFECRKCQFKIGKTRADRSSSSGNFMGSTRGDQSILGSNVQMSVENYSVVFWDFLQTNTEMFEPNFAQMVAHQLEEEDFNCVRDLYKRIKEIISCENAERVFGLTDTAQLLEIHEYLDEMFEIVVTDNALSNTIFREANRKKANALSCLYADQGTHSQQTQQQAQRLAGYNPNQVIMQAKQPPNFFKPNLKEFTDEIMQERSKQRQTKLEDAPTLGQKRTHDEMSDQNAAHTIYKPYNFENQLITQTVDNYFLLQQIGYLERRVLESHNIQNFIGYFSQTFSKRREYLQNQKFKGMTGQQMAQLNNKKGRGRPRRVEVQYDDLKDPRKVSADLLILPMLHGLTLEQLIKLDGNEQITHANVPALDFANRGGSTTINERNMQAGAEESAQRSGENQLPANQSNQAWKKESAGNLPGSNQAARQQTAASRS